MPAILRLNKEINKESMPFLYSRNTFAFAGLEECQAFTNPNIPGRSLISHIRLPRMAMSRPASRWSSLHTFLPSNLRRLTIEIDTYRRPLPKVCESLCRGLKMYLKQVASEPEARRVHFREVVTLQLPTTMHRQDLVELISDAQRFSAEPQKLLWRRLAQSPIVSHADVEQ